MKRIIQMKSIFALLLIAFCCYSLSIVAENPGKKKKKEKSQTEYIGHVGTTITLVTSGTGETKENAVKNALRSALEQTYGAFVSSDSKFVNDELISDEIVSISTGNIARYEILSINDSNPVEVTTKVVVSISNLQSYAKNKGMSAELAGNTFAMNLKMEELNKKNQDVALKHLLEQTKIMSRNMFDYEISVDNPKKYRLLVYIPVTIRIRANNNTITYYDYFHKTLSSLAVQKKQGRDVHLYGKQGVEIDGWKPFDSNKIVYVLRGEGRDPEPHNTIHSIFSTLGGAVLNCEIVDNLGNVSGFTKEHRDYKNLTSDYVPTNKLSPLIAEWDVNCSLYGYRDNYISDQGWRSFSITYLGYPGGVYFWMNAARPKAGEKLYEAKLYLWYSVEEISKISKIEIRPKSRRY